MRTIIAGSRGFWKPSFDIYMKFHAEGLGITQVVCGQARGPDTWGGEWAYANDIPIKYFPANWDMLGKRAGYVRNQQMADNADMLIAFWDGKSRGTKHMIDIANAKGLKVIVVTGD